MCLLVYANLCVSIGADGGLWEWDLTTHEVPRDTYKQPLTPIDTHIRGVSDKYPTCVHISALELFLVIRTVASFEVVPI